jgi:hypothetical protein
MIETLRLTYYTHFNPVKHGLVKHPVDWRIRRFANAWPRGSIRPDGAAATKSHSRRASGADRSGGVRPGTPALAGGRPEVFRPTFANLLGRRSAPSGARSDRSGDPWCQPALHRRKIDLQFGDPQT